MNAADERNGRDADEAIRDLTLMLMYLTSWEERPYGVLRFWKGYDFDVLNALAEQELISDSKRARSVCFTEEGEHRARDLLAKYKIVAP